MISFCYQTSFQHLLFLSFCFFCLWLVWLVCELLHFKDFGGSVIGRRLALFVVCFGFVWLGAGANETYFSSTLLFHLLSFLQLADCLTVGLPDWLAICPSFRPLVEPRLRQHLAHSPAGFAWFLVSSVLLDFICLAFICLLPSFSFQC